MKPKVNVRSVLGEPISKKVYDELSQIWMNISRFENVEKNSMNKVVYLIFIDNEYYEEEGVFHTLEDAKAYVEESISYSMEFSYEIHKFTLQERIKPIVTKSVTW